MATVKALEGRTVHQIQSGQVIVDLSSVAKELVENSLDAGATSIEVRFKNHGLDSIEVQDNGSGVSSDNYETIALKHYTSKLDSYHGLNSLTTFGFRGEALSSLCALSDFHIITAQEVEVPKGTRLDYQTSGKLRGTSVVASQKGTTITIENLFHNLPVRRRELEKNIKREYGKVLAILQAYACISTQARLSVTNVMAKGKKAVVFATRSSNSTRENIANIFGAKTLSSLVTMDMELEMELTETALRAASRLEDRRIRVIGHVSRPVFGEGRQAPDRQMFFVNSRPCNLPQLAKVFNEVYKSFNVSQMPFIFANIVLDTNAYDVNVSPDKRTILLHEQTALLNSLRSSLILLFERQDQTIPFSERTIAHIPAFKQLAVGGENSIDTSVQRADFGGREEQLNGVTVDEDAFSAPFSSDDDNATVSGLIEKFAARGTTDREELPRSPSPEEPGGALSKDKQKLVGKLRQANTKPTEPDAYDNADPAAHSDAGRDGKLGAMEDFNARLVNQQGKNTDAPDSSPLSDKDAMQLDVGSCGIAAAPTSSIVQNAFDRMRPRRKSPEIATVTIGSKTTTTVLGPSIHSQYRSHPPSATASRPHSTPRTPPQQQFSSSMQAFAAPDSNLVKTVGPPRSKARPSRPHQHVPSSVKITAEESDQMSESEPEPAGSENAGPAVSDESDSGVSSGGSEYVDEAEKKVAEEAKVAEMIRAAQEGAALPTEDSIKRATQALKGKLAKDTTTNLVLHIDASLISIEQRLTMLEKALQKADTLSTTEDGRPTAGVQEPVSDSSTPDPLTLTVTKQDFANLHIIGQFNLGFILAARRNIDLFIIDQHASDEKINFERLYQTTVMQNQRLVHPHQLCLSAVDEEIVLENQDTLIRNGFIVSVDDSGDVPVGQRVKLLSLPMSKETTFTVSDFEELVAMLSETPAGAEMVRPTRMRKLFAMRACRSSVMIGKTLTRAIMGSLVGKMGQIDKPWNCPHGRPTMRHVCGLGGWDKGGRDRDGERIDWQAYLTGMREESGDAEGEDKGSEEDVDP